jgi:hypothetical protein
MVGKRNCEKFIFCCCHGVDTETVDAHGYVLSITSEGGGLGGVEYKLKK